LNVYFTAEDVRQYAYCKRIPYFRYVLRARVKPSVKMKRGKEEHSKIGKRKREGNAYFNVYLASVWLGLAGFVDYFVYNGEIIPVEVKFGRGGRVYMGHYLQLVAQALLLESCFGVEVKRGVIEYVDEGVRREVTITDRSKRRVLEILSNIRKIVEKEEIPSATPNVAKCLDCEFYKVCKRC